MPISKNIVLSKEWIEDTDLSPLYKHLSWTPQYLQYFQQASGQEPFKLLGYISKHCQGVATDVGTQFGSSALALSLNSDLQVDTYDKFKLVPNNNPSAQVLTIENRPNITYRILSAQSVISKIAKSTVVYLDINTTDGVEETKIIHQLQQLNFKGILILDDIHLNDTMKTVWSSIPNNLKKIDATAFGHWSGTGIIVYDPSFIDVNIAT
jgi:hypothetical protein